MHKCLVTKLWLLADSFQVSVRLISDFIHIKHSSGKARLPFQSSAAIPKPATTPGSTILHKQRRHFLRGFSSPSSPTPCIQKFPFLSFSPAPPQQSPTRSSPDTR